MVFSKINLISKCGLGIALLAVLLLGNIRPYAMSLNSSDLERVRGTGFWDDPCTRDGFLFGSSAVLCGAGYLSGCGSAIATLFWATKADNCF
jgi:hypothetical protein